MADLINHKKKKAPAPSTVIALSFLIIIFLGAVLFTLPFMTRDGEGLPFLTALFTATSSVCVTGLTLIDPMVTLTRYGQVLLALLIEIGGISMVTFVGFFAFSFKKKTSFRNVRLAQEYTNIDVFSEVKSLVRVIIAVAFSCQALGALVLMIRFIPLFGAKGVWISLFTAISAYCNAGFDLFGIQQEFGSLINFNGDPLVMFTIMALIVSGGIGFFVFYDLLHFRKSRHLSLHTRVVTIFTLILIFAGFVVFFLSEGSNSATIGDMPLSQKLIASLFQSITTRTAGFASVDIASMRDLTKVFMLLLMFVGAGSGSTGGGIKITTFAVIVMSVFSVIKNKDDTLVFGYRVDRKTVSKALSIAVLGLFVVFCTSCILFVDNPQADGINVMFEAFSAFATVGLSSGITLTAGTPGLLALILTMFIGRLGPICFALAFNRSLSDKTGIVHPEGRIMVG